MRFHLQNGKKSYITRKPTSLCTKSLALKLKYDINLRGNGWETTKKNEFLPHKIEDFVLSSRLKHN